MAILNSLRERINKMFKFGKDMDDPKKAIGKS